MNAGISNEASHATIRMEVRRQIATATFIAGVCLIILIAEPVMGVGPGWPENGLIAISFVIVVIFAWAVWDALQREFRRDE